MRGTADALTAGAARTPAKLAQPAWRRRCEALRVVWGQCSGSRQLQPLIRGWGSGTGVLLFSSGAEAADAHGTQDTSGSPGDPAMNGSGGPRPAVRHVMSIGVGIFVVALGAILLFALPAGSPHWLNLQVVGIILILVGVLGLTLPRMQRGGTRSGLMQRWLMPGQFPLPADRSKANGPRLGDDVGGPLLREFSDSDPPTLADDILSEEHDPPL